MASVRFDGSTVHIDTYLLSAEIHTEGYVSGVAGGTLLDKTSSARDLGHGLDIVDFLMEPLPDEPDAEHPYHRGDDYHGDMVKRYVELPQICTGAKKVQARAWLLGEKVVVKQWFAYTDATYGRDSGSLWEQTLVFQDGLRYFISSDRITSANTVDGLILRIDMPGHLKHNGGDNFEQIYLSYEGALPASEFIDDFRPDDRHLYQRDDAAIPDRIIRGYQAKLDGEPGPWLAGMTLDPSAVYEAWCHQRGYVCFIEEIGGRRVEAGDTFGAAYIVGWFDSLDEMRDVYDAHKGMTPDDVMGEIPTG